MTKSERHTLLLIDANSVIHRAFHALPPLTTSDGRPGQALYGLSSILLRLLREDPPTYIAALFDRPEPTFRKKQYEDYKATRLPTADELIEQIISAHDLFPAFGIPVFEAAGFEADDCIATFVHRFGHEPDLQTIILTGDRDTLQLVENDTIVVRAFRRGVTDTKTYDEAAIREDYGLLPTQLCDYKAFVGDQSDNIKGVSGIGPKTAAALLQEHGTLEQIFAAAEKDEKLGKKILPQKEQALFARSLVVLRTDAPIAQLPLSDLRFVPDEARLGSYFDQLGFSSLRKRMGGAPAEGENGASGAQKPARHAKKAKPAMPPQAAMF